MQTGHFLLTFILAFHLSFLAKAEAQGEVYNISLSLSNYDLKQTGFSDSRQGQNIDKLFISTRQARLSFLDESTIRLKFEKPIVLNLTDKESSNSVIQRILPHIDIELSTRQRTHFEMIRRTDVASAVMVSEIPEETINFKEFMNRVHSLEAKDFANGRIYQVPLLLKPINTLHIENLPLGLTLEGKAPVTSISIDSRIIRNIDLAANRASLSQNELHRINLAENMDFVFIQDSRVANLAQFRETARRMKDETLSKLQLEASLPTSARGSQAKTQSQVQNATILQFGHTKKMCRLYLGSPVNKSQVIYVNF